MRSRVALSGDINYRPGAGERRAQPGSPCAQLRGLLARRAGARARRAGAPSGPGRAGPGREKSGGGAAAAPPEERGRHLPAAGAAPLRGGGGGGAARGGGQGGAAGAARPRPGDPEPRLGLSWARPSTAQAARFRRCGELVEGAGRHRPRCGGVRRRARGWARGCCPRCAGAVGVVGPHFCA